MLHLVDSWVWDFWLADDGESYHIFFLYAPRTLPSPDQRHFHVRIGHAVSTDLRAWERVPDALGPNGSPAFDDLATWTGSVVRGDDERWYMFYTGASRAEDGLVQRIGLATSQDLFSWERAGPVLVADSRWYETLDQTLWPDQAWRDPWVFRDAGGRGWHMLLTARANHGSPDDRGVIGHGTSRDLLEWVVEPPLSQPGQGFGQLEVPQVELLDGRPVLFFSCLGPELADERRPGSGGIWAAVGDSVLGGWDIKGAQRLTDESLYAGRVVRNRAGEWVMMAFQNVGPDGRFMGDISDPLPLSTHPSGEPNVLIDEVSQKP